MENSSQQILSVLNPILNGLNSSTRAKISEIAKDPIFTPVYDVSLRQTKEIALERLKKVMGSKTNNTPPVSIRDFLTNPENIFTTHEMLGFIDGSLATKFTVQFNLFGGTIVGLGTQQHEFLYDKIDNLSTIGCFCLTELGFGNNAVEMQTTATWDNKTNQFIINTPTVISQKYWITNGAYHADHAVVFAQTIVNDKHEGINAFIVRIRDVNTMQTCPGVTIDDMGCKQGMNAVDNARVILRNVPVPPQNLLNKLATISSNGKFSSTITNRRQRFLAASNRLLSGRLCIASMAISSAKLALLITSKYASVRLSNGPTGKSDTAVINYQLFKNHIVPLIARTITLNIGLLHCREVYSEYLLNLEKYENDKVFFNNVVRLACAIKPLVAWHTNQTGNVCRERTGGQGYLSINRIEEVIPFAHASITAEGDSAVLIQKVSKEYVDDYLKKKLGKPVINFTKDNVRKMSSVMDLDVLFNLIKFREGELLDLLAGKTSKNSKAIFDLWYLNESNLIQDLGKTYGERICVEQSIMKLSGKK